MPANIVPTTVYAGYNMPIPDQPQRMQALNPSASYIVQAPAGSGKTELLTQRFLKLLSTVQQPEEIVALTFTRRAANEMRQRIVQALQQSKKPKPSEKHLQNRWILARNAVKRSEEKHWHLMQNPNRLRIMTIDALAGSICQQLSGQPKLHIQGQIEPHPQSLYMHAATQLLNELEVNQPSYRALNILLNYYDNQPDRLLRLLCDMLACREQWLPYIVVPASKQRRKLLESQLQKLAQQKIEDAIQTWQQAFSDNEHQQLQEILHYAAHNLNKIDNSSGCEKLCISSNIIDYNHFHDLDVWQCISNILLRTDGNIRKTVQKKQGFPSATQTTKPGSKKHEDNEKLDKAEKHYRIHYKQLIIQHLRNITEKPGLIEALRAIQTCPPTQYSSTQWEVLEALCQLLPRCVAYLHLAFNEQQCTDFIEINLQAKHALGEDNLPTELAMQLDYSIQHILVDEFQDTSYLHYEFLTQLIAGWQQEDGRSLFIVGDPMQSIYRFRNAEVSLFTHTQRHGMGDIVLTNITLLTNFRSSTTLVQWINQACQSFFPAQDNIETAAISYTPAIAANTVIPSGPLPQQAVQWLLSATPDTEAAKQLQAEQIAEQAAAIKQQSPDDSIAILVRARRHLTTICQLLRQKKLAFFAVDIEPLSHQPAILDLSTLCRALCHLEDDIAWYSVLRAPYCGLNLHTLLEISQAYQQSNMTSVSHFLLTSTAACLRLQDTAQHKRLYRCIQVLKACITQSDHNSLRTWVYTCWLHLGGPATLQDSYELHYCDIFFNLLDELDQHTGHLDFELLSSRLQHAFINNTPQGEGTPIQIMTVHKSKGLEFDHVFIPHLESRSRALTSHVLNWAQLPQKNGQQPFIIAPLTPPEDTAPEPIYQYLRNLEKNKQQLETTRLLYVAITRAKKHLYLCYTDTSKPSKLENLDHATKNENTKDTAGHVQPTQAHTAAEMALTETPASDSDVSSVSAPASSLAYLLQSYIITQFKKNLHLVKHSCNASVQAEPDTLDFHDNSPQLLRISPDWSLGATLDKIHKNNIHNKATNRVAHEIIDSTTDPHSKDDNCPHIPTLAQQQGILIHAALAKLSQLPTSCWKNYIRQSIPQWQQQLSGYGTLPQLATALKIIQYSLLHITDCRCARWFLDSNTLTSAHSEQTFSVCNHGTPRQFIIDRSFVSQGCAACHNLKDNTLSTRWIIDYKCILPPGISNQQLLDMITADHYKSKVANKIIPTQCNEAIHAAQVNIYYNTAWTLLLDEQQLQQFVLQQIQQHQRQLLQYAHIFQQIHTKQPLCLGLYFPLMQLYCDWPLHATQTTQVLHRDALTI